MDNLTESNYCTGSEKHLSTRGKRISRSGIAVGCGMVFVFLASVLTTSNAYAEDDAAGACEEAARLLRETDDLTGALAEAQWCLDGIKEMQDKQVLSVFPDEVGGYKGEEPARESSFGLSIISREYSDGSNRIRVSMTQGALAGQGLAAIAQVAMQLAGDSSRKFRVQRRTALQLEESGNQMFTVQLRSGGLMNIGSETASVETVREFLEAMPVADMDDSLSR